MVALKNLLPKDTDTKQVLAVTIGAFIFLTAITLFAYNQAKGRPSTTVLPGGVTYLGPSSTPSYQATKSSPPVGTIPVDNNAKWQEQKGNVFPYTFSYPSNLALGVFPGDPFDPITIFYKDTNANENIFLRVEDLSTINDMKQYINKPKKDYALVWWKQYTWKGVNDIQEFTNSTGMKGYKVKYIDGLGKTPYDIYFFEVPKRPELVIWMASSLVEPAVFAKMVDTLAWKPTGTTPKAVPTSK